MKAVKVILIIVLVLAAIVVALGFIGPKEYKIERSIVINAPTELIFEQVSFLENIESWSPWRDYDPDMKNTYEGVDGAVGAIVHWEGNDDVGNGSQKLTKIIENERIEMEVTFKEPMKMVNNSFIQLSDDTDGKKVTWGFEGTNNFIGRIFAVFMNMDDMIGKDFENGLNKLKTKCDTLALLPRTYRGYSIAEIEYTTTTFIGKKATLPFTHIGSFYANNLSAAFQAIMEAGLQPAGPPSGLYYEFDAESQITTMAACVAVELEEGIEFENLETIIVDGSKALRIEYFGAYEQIGEAHMAMDEYIVEKGLTQLAPVIEQYVTDPQSEPDTTKWQTNVVYLVN